MLSDTNVGEGMADVLVEDEVCWLLVTVTETVAEGVVTEVTELTEEVAEDLPDEVVGASVTEETVDVAV